MKYLFTFLLFALLFSNSYCQGKKNLPKNDSKFSFELNAYTGKVFKHSTKFTPNVTEMSYGVELSASYKTFGTKNWNRALNYPEIGIAYVQTHFGNKEIFGETYGLLPFIKFNILRSKYIDFYARLGAGLGYITKTFHPVSNPTNNVIGSKLNSLIQFRMGLDFHIHKEIDLVLAGAFTHYSNSSTQAPNLGINLPSLNLGVIYKPNHFEKKYTVTKNPKEFQKKNEYSFKFGLGIKDKNPWGAKFPVYSGALQYARFIGFANKLLVGTTVSFDQYEYDFMLIQEIDKDKNQELQAMDWSLYGGYEMMLGNVGINFIVGAYLLNKGDDAPLWAKPGITYYFTEFGKTKHKPFIGINIKTHYFVAQFVEIHTGIAF